MFDKNNWLCKPKTKEEAFEIIYDKMIDKKTV